MGKTASADKGAADVPLAVMLLDEPMAEPEGGWPADEYTGKGGSYVRDPLTGLRSPAPVANE